MIGNGIYILKQIIFIFERGYYYEFKENDNLFTTFSHRLITTPNCTSTTLWNETRFLLAMMFIALIIAKDYKTTLVIGILSGILTAATTTFPAGQIPNLVDKIITTNILFLLVKFTDGKVKIK